MIAATLDALAARAHARLPREPQLHVKRVLGVHALDYLEALDALGGPQPGPAGDLTAELEGAIAAGDDLEVLVPLRQAVERHRLELPDRPFSLTGEQPPPARDAFVELGAATPGPHADLNRALLLAEVAASTTHEVDFPTRLELARIAAAFLGDTAALDAELEAPWGSEPVTVDAYAQLMALPAADRVRELVGERARRDEDAAV